MKQIKRVLFEIGIMETAGAQRMVIDLAIYYKRQGYNVLILALCEDPHNSFSDLLKKHKIKVCYVPNSNCFIKRVFYRYSAVSRTIRKFRPDIIHGHLDYKYLWIYALINRKRIIMTFHSQAYRLNNHFIRRMFSLLHNKGLIIPVCLTRSNCVEFSDLFGVEKQIIRIIPNPIDVSRFCQIGIYENRSIVRYCFAARFHPIKNHEMLIRAFKRVRNEIKNCELILAGEGETKNEIERLVSELELSECVRFLGDVADIPALLRGIDVGVISSNSESFSIFLLECMAAGIPVIVTRVGGMRDILDGNGVFVEKGDVEGMANAMIKLGRDRELRRGLGAKGIGLIKQYDITTVAEQYLKLYDEVNKK